MTELKIDNLVKRYQSKRVVKGLSMRFSQGEIIGLLGPNGAGKTTTFYMIVGLIKPTSGQIYLNEKNISHFPLHKRARLGIGYLPQETSIFQKLNVEQNILSILQLQKNLTKAEQHSKLNKLLKQFNIHHLRSVEAIRLSGGEKRRVEIARALAAHPEFLLLDEPFAGIDPISITEIKSIIKSLAAQGIGILITDHNVRETLDICHRAYIVSNGNLIAEGECHDILQNKTVRDIYLGQEFKL